MRLARALYLAVQLALLVGSVTVQQPAQAALAVLVVIVGTATFTVQVARRRPQPLLAWWLIAAGAWTVIAEAFSVTFVYGASQSITINAPVPSLIATVPYPLLAAGLLVLSRTTGRRGQVDALDASMIALATFLLLWVYVFDEVFTLNPLNAAITILLPVGALLAFAMAVKVTLSGGMRDPVTALLVVFVGLLVGVTVGSFVIGLNSGAYGTNALTDALWSVDGLLLGLIALLPTFARPPQPSEVGSSDMSASRVIVFSLLVQVPLLAWYESIFGQRGRHERPSVIVALAVSAVFLVLLVTRLALLARLAQRRASDLRSRTDQLAAAVNEQLALQEQLRHQATHDPLTGLANRTVLTERLAASRRAQESADAALLMIDLDGFKAINDSYGHLAGDELLRQTAQRLRASGPAGATLARLGGDEFVMLFETEGPASAGEVADQIVDAMREPFHADGQELRVSVSIGVVVVRRDQALSSAEILHDADIALYQAKQAGRNRAVIREPSERS